MENMVKLSPQEMKGTIWDENGKTKVVQILISHDPGVLSIQFVYVVDEKVVQSEMHGNPAGKIFDIVTFEYPGEYLVSINCEQHGLGLASIVFGTNKRKYGPFGSSREGQVTYNFRPKYSFGGFHGSVYNSKMYAIGIYVRPLGSLDEIETILPLRKSDDADDQVTCFKISG